MVCLDMHRNGSDVHYSLLTGATYMAQVSSFTNMVTFATDMSLLDSVA